MKRLLSALLVSSLIASVPPAISTAKPAAAKSPRTKTAARPADDEKKKSKYSSETFSGLEFRSIGPALTSGRIVDFVVHPRDKSTWFVAAAYGGVWKSTNAGTTWTPIFDSQGTSSVGCLAIDPSDPLVVWAGSGENNSQRSVGWGDGVYKSVDGGKSWSNVGLKASEHIGQIAIHPRNSSVVLVAAQGPLWASGGDRGVYRTTDGGKTWTRVLHVDDWTGANEVRFDPRNPDVLYASTYQRHRKVWTLIDGGPGSGVWKSTDGGVTWTRLKNGLPTEDMGRIGLALPPVEPDVVIAWVEAANAAGGVYRSADAGANWEKLSPYVSGSPQYYQEIFADPKQPGRLYAMDTWLNTSDDGGRTWRRLGNRARHVDDHAFWIDPDDNRHVIVGGDGGLYESFDRGQYWSFFANLPITQFYKLEVDNDVPFYNVYGGTQDNNTQGGPSRTTNEHGIRNSDWFITLGGDGFQPRVDPEDPNIVYSQYQHAGLVRFDKRNGEAIDIQPQPEKGEAGSRWNWDAPLVISPHQRTRLYFASQRVYRSDDRGDSWRPVSPDLTRQLDRNRLPVMDRVWGVDAVAKNASTSFYGNIVALTESPLAEGLLYAGTDDGLIQVSENGGSSWRKVDSFPGIGPYAYVSRVEASRHAKNTAYATFDRHKMGDFKPYVLRSTDLGRSWTSISGDLPANGSVYCLAEDTKDPSLLFVGTEFGVFFTQDGGKRWVQLKGGLPVACIRDLAIQRREDDLVLGTFSRGFYVLDDLTPLRHMREPRLAEAAVLLPVRKSWMYVPSSPMGGRDRAEQGERLFVAPNPPFGAVFTYYLSEGLKSRKAARGEREKEVAKEGGNVFYPSWDSLRTEANEEEPAILLTVSDEAGNAVRRIKAPAGKGFHRVAWDLRFPSARPTNLTPPPRDRYDDSNDGPFAAPGTYRVSMAKRVDGALVSVGEPQTFVCEPLANATLPAKDRTALAAFQLRTARLQRAMTGTTRALGEAQSRVSHLKQALDDTPGADAALMAETRAVEAKLRELSVEFNGDPVIRGRNEPTPPSLVERLNQVVGGHWTSTSDATQTHRRDYAIAAEGFADAHARLKRVFAELEALEQRADAAGAPWTPGRLPEWKPE